MEEKEVNSDCCSGWLCSSRLNWMVRMRKQKAFQNLLFDLQVRLLLELLLTLLFLVYFGLLSIEQKNSISVRQITKRDQDFLVTDIATMQFILQTFQTSALGWSLITLVFHQPEHYILKYHQFSLNTK